MQTGDAVYIKTHGVGKKSMELPHIWPLAKRELYFCCFIDFNKTVKLLCFSVTNVILQNPRGKKMCITINHPFNPIPRFTPQRQTLYPVS